MLTETYIDSLFIKQYSILCTGLIFIRNSVLVKYCDILHVSIQMSSSVTLEFYLKGL